MTFLVFEQPSGAAPGRRYLVRNPFGTAELHGTASGSSSSKKIALEGEVLEEDEQTRTERRASSA